MPLQFWPIRCLILGLGKPCGKTDNSPSPPFSQGSHNVDGRVPVYTDERGIGPIRQRRDVGEGRFTFDFTTFGMDWPDRPGISNFATFSYYVRAPSTATHDGYGFWSEQSFKTGSHAAAPALAESLAASGGSTFKQKKHKLLFNFFRSGFNCGTGGSADDRNGRRCPVVLVAAGYSALLLLFESTRAAGIDFMLPTVAEGRG